MRTRSRFAHPEYIRNFTFGVEDSLASSVGLLAGIASAELSSTAIVVTGFILIFPYVFFTRVDGMYVSITATLLALFGLGVLNARWAGIHVLKNGLRMLAIGGVVALSGIIAGDFLKLVF